MRAAVVTRFGAPDVIALEERDDPRPRPDQVLIGVDFADVLWVATMIRRGLGREHFDHEPPYIPENGVASTVTAIGAEVDPAPGRGAPVVAHTGQYGGYADRALASLSDVVRPRTASRRRARPHSSTTGSRRCGCSRSRAPTRTPPCWWSGRPALGIAAMQLAAARGALVVATARGERKLRRLGELSPAALMDSDLPGWVARARDALGERGANVILDNIGGQLGAAAFEAIARGGHFSARGRPSATFAAVDAREAERPG